MKRSHRRLIPTDVGIGGKLYDRLSERIIGQDDAIKAVVSAVEQRTSGMLPVGQPVANFLFLGPTGTGKTHVAETVAEVMAGFRDSLVIVDCAEFQHSQDVSKLVGAPPGYIGHRETSPALSQENLNKSLSKTCDFSFVLFDEIEKASDSVWNLLLGIMSKARMRTGASAPVNFEKCMIFLTSNLGADQMEKFLRPPMGLAPGPSQDEIDQKLGTAGAAAARKKFSPEFMNRIDYTLTFRPLDHSSLCQILDLELSQLQDNVFAQRGEKGYMFAVSEEAREEILRQGTDPRYGARFLKRAMKKHLMDPLSKMVCTGQVKAGDMALLDYKHGKFEMFVELEKLNTLQMGWAQNLIYAKGVVVPSMRHFKVLEEPAA